MELSDDEKALLRELCRHLRPLMDEQQGNLADAEQRLERGQLDGMRRSVSHFRRESVVFHTIFFFKLQFTQTPLHQGMPHPQA